MLRQILLGSGLVGLTVVFQALVTVVGLRCLDLLEKRKQDFTHRHAVLVTVFFVLLMFLAVIVDVWMWAGFYYHVEMTKTFEEALYFSTTTFTTLGYGDVVPPREWRILASIEGANGLMIFGWATAFVVAAIQHFNVWLTANK